MDTSYSSNVLPLKERLTIAEAIEACAAALQRAELVFGHGTDNAADEAAWLLAHARGSSPLELPDYAHDLDANERDAINDIISRRIDTRKPAAYLTGRTWFAGHEFICDERALVPRSPLAEFINGDFFGLLADVPDARILDLCTGGGCIAIAAALARLDAQVHASDLSADALSLAAENIALHGLENRVQLFHGSVFEPVNARYDLIVSNPPYVDAPDIAAMAPEFHCEPAMGLGAGPDGMDIVEPMLASAVDHLTESGWLVVEVGNSAEAVERRWPMLEPSWLEFAGGGSGVFAVQREDLLRLPSP